MGRRLPILSILPLMASAVLAACGDSTVSLRAAAAGSASAAKGGPPAPVSINVTTTIFDQDASGNPVLMRSDDFNGAGLATYTSSSGHGSSLTSWITTGGGWQILLNAQTARTVYLVLGSQGMPNIPDGYYYDYIEVFTRCFDQSNTKVSLLDMTAGASNGNCTFGLDFGIGRTKYRLALGPDFDAAAPTGRALVTCTSAANGACTSWTIATNPSTASTFTLTNGQVVSAPAASLYVLSTPPTYKGSYHNSFYVKAAE